MQSRFSPTEMVRPANEERTESSMAPTSPGRPPRLSLPSYDVGDVIGKGGMGEVLLAHDPKIGRNIAVDRFLREAKIQARLDHPAIVPVYELGQDENGHPYFTMKRLAGTTLYEVL